MQMPGATAMSVRKRALVRLVWDWDVCGRVTGEEPLGFCGHHGQSVIQRDDKLAISAITVTATCVVSGWLTSYLILNFKGIKVIMTLLPHPAPVSTLSISDLTRASLPASCCPDYQDYPTVSIQSKPSQPCPWICTARKFRRLKLQQWDLVKGHRQAGIKGLEYFDIWVSQTLHWDIS